MIVRQKPSSLYQAPCSGASIALIGIDFRPETAEKIAPPCMARLDVDNCRLRTLREMGEKWWFEKVKEAKIVKKVKMSDGS